MDREELAIWYRQAMVRRIEELRSLRAGLAAGDPAAGDAARAVGQALRGSGATFGFRDLTAVAALVETAPGAAILRRVEGLIEHLHVLGDSEDRERPLHAEWLARAAGVVDDGDPGAFRDVEQAWELIGRRSRLDGSGLAKRVADLLGLSTADLSRPSHSALRLVPQALMRSGWVLPVGEDSETITVATADPTSLAMELELIRITGRTPVFVVAPPAALEHALSQALAAAPPAKSRPVRAMNGGDHATGRVLLVDDDGSSRLLVRTALEKRGYEVVEAGNGLDALESLREAQPVSLVVADLNMPQMDGLELIWEIRASEEWSHIPVIVLTGDTDDVLETKLIEEGAADYICKPIDPRLFLARVGATIRRAED